MVNMAYCRFRNTRLAMKECINALENRESILEEELEACKRMFTDIVNYLYDEGIEIDDDAFSEFFERLDNTLEIE